MRSGVSNWLQCECRNVREMWMGMACNGMLVPMFVRLAAIPLEIVRVLVVGVMDMPMAMFDRLMHMSVFMMLGEVQQTPAPISPAASQNASTSIHRAGSAQPPRQRTVQ